MLKSYRLTPRFYFVPDVDDWDKYSGENIQTYHKTGLQLSTGALYTVRVGVSNNAGEMTIHETNGVKLDLSEPKVKIKDKYPLCVLSKHKNMIN